MKLIRNKSEFEANYPYRGSKPKKYPSRYPILLENEICGGGIGGDYYNQVIIQIPKGVDVKSFIKGVNAQPTRICI